MRHPLYRLAAILLLASSCLPAQFYERGRQTLLCHRMANRDAPENTIESLRQAHLLGCDVTEIDIWRTVDGELVLFHDGPIDRVSTGSGEVEKMLADELALYDGGAWFNGRFTGARHPRFVEALRFAKDSGIKLVLDHKSKGITREVFEIVKAEGMLERVSIGGSAEELAKLQPGIARQSTVAWKPDMTREQVAAQQREGKFVVASFSANDHEMDLVMMRRAAAAGVDAINTDHPRLAAEALGRSLEKRALALAQEARTGDTAARIRAIGKLGDLVDLPLDTILSQLVADPDKNVSRAAAVALVKRRDPVFLPALIKSLPAAGGNHSVANAAWAAGMLAAADPAVARWLLVQAESSDPGIAVESLRAISRIRVSPVPSALLLRRLRDGNPMVRGAAARALAQHDPSSTAALIAAAKQLQDEIRVHWSSYAPPQAYDAFGRHRTTFERPAPANPKAIAQIARAQELYRGYHNVLQALASMPNAEARAWLHELTLRAEYDFTGYSSYVAAFQLWDRVDPDTLVRGLTMDDPMRRDRVEWTLTKHGPASAAALRPLLQSKDADARLRAAQTLAWIGDSQSRPALERLAAAETANRDVYEWCLGKLSEVEKLRKAAF